MTVKGIIDNILFRSADGRYSVVNIISDDFEDGEMICTGMLLGADQGDCVEVTGELYDHPTHGIQMKVNSFKVSMPEDSLSIERYLASGAIKGIGPALAKRIVKKFGNRTMEILEKEPERLIEIKGISERIARDISEQFTDKKDVRDAFIFLQGYGIGNNLAVKIYEKYGNQLYGILKDNPYRMAKDIRGVGFKTVDEIAIRNGVSIDSTERIKGAMYYCLQQSMMEGHTFLPKEELFSKTAELLEYEGEIPEEILGELCFEKLLKVKENSKVFLSYVYHEELSVAGALREIRDAFDPEDCSDSEKARISHEIDDLKTLYNFTLDNIQKEAVIGAIQNGVYILTGGPGTGKTTTIRTIIRYFYNKGYDVLLAAPTGRAAKRMEEATGFEAKTIHRLLEVEGGNTEEDRARFSRNEENPLEADVIIIDEMSMVDINLFYSLLNAIMPGTKLILAGDSNQLPSVGPGNVLKDLIESNAFCMTELKKIYRQSEESDIVTNAHKIISGVIPELNNAGKDFFFLQRDSKEIIYRDIVLLLRDKLPKQFKTTTPFIQVLSPMKKGYYGVEALNKLLQEQLNPASDMKKETSRGDTVFREGDKVMQIKNNYEMQWEIKGFNSITTETGKGVFNGDVGIITAVNTYMKSLVVCFDDKREAEYPFSQLDELEPAYAVTIHKSQGSEYPCIVIPIVDGPSMLFNRNLLYTAVTRASECVIILGNKSKLEEMIINKGDQKRYTDLKERLTELMNG